jgi:methionine-gamma-lyase
MNEIRRNSVAGLATRAIHLGYDPATEQRALNPPIYVTSTYVFETAEAGSEMFKGERHGYIYGRTRQPKPSWKNVSRAWKAARQR